MGLLDIWSDWRKESGYGLETEKTVHPLAKNRSDLSTAGGVSADMDKRIPRKRGEIPTPPKYIREKKEVRDRLGRVVEQGSPVQSADFQTRFTGKKNGQWMGPGQAGSTAKTPNLYQDKIMQGGVGTKQGEDPSWWQGLANKFNSKFDMDSAVANWKDKGGFEGLMSNPAFTMGLAFMQSGAEGKTLGQGALDNIMKAGGISSHYKQIIEDRKLEPIQATASDIGEVKDMLKSINIEEGNWIENLIHGPKSGAKYEAAVEEIAVKFQEEIRKKQKALKEAGESQIIRRTDQIAILERLVNSKKIKKKGSWLSKIGITSETLQMDLPNKAQGGPVQAGKPYVVGEKGPEVIIPRSDGNVLANDDSQIFAMLLASNPQLQNVSKQRAERILRSRFPEYFEG